jgi:hypothetical protein
MTDVHVPRLDDDEPVAPATPAQTVPRAATAASGGQQARGRSFGKLVLEVVLISIGVFLGLAGEQWRESAHDRELAHASLRRFRSEFRANRKAVAEVRDRHEKKLKDMRAYFAAHRSELRAHEVDVKVPIPQPLPDTATDPAFFEYAAWDLALATQSLAHMDQDLAFAIAHVYQVQRQIDESTRAITQTMYSFSDELTWLRSVTTYFGDCTLLEPRLVTIYDDILPRLDRAIGDSADGNDVSR